MYKTDHMAFEVSDMDAAVEFYVQKLGLTLKSRGFNEGQGEEESILAIDGANLELLRSLSDPLVSKPQVRAPYCPHFALTTEDMDETLKMVKREGISIVKGPLEVEGLVRWLYVSGPDNNIIEFVQWLS